MDGGVCGLRGQRVRFRGVRRPVGYVGDAIENDAQDALVGAGCRQVQADCVLISTTHYHGTPGLGEILTRIRTERANCRFATQKVGKLTMRTVRQRAKSEF